MYLLALMLTMERSLFWIFLRIGVFTVACIGGVGERSPGAYLETGGNPQGIAVRSNRC